MVIARFEGCVPYNPKLGNRYGYKPSLIAGIVFCSLFGTTMVVHIIQACWKRSWFTLVFAIGASSELIGWAGRTWSAECPSNLNAFLMQITTLIIAPAFFTAGLYVILGRLINITGGKGKTSAISSKVYLYIFCSCDIISLIVQAFGGAKASKAASADPPTESKSGTNIMVGGIIFQLLALTVFIFFFLDFLRRCRKLNAGLLTRHIKLLLAATVFSGVMIYIRSVYRTLELLQGFKGYLIRHEIYFVVFDGALMVLAIAVFNFVHPGWLLPGEYVIIEDKEKDFLLQTQDQYAKAGRERAFNG